MRMAALRLSFPKCVFAKEKAAIAIGKRSFGKNKNLRKVRCDFDV